MGNFGRHDALSHDDWGILRVTAHSFMIFGEFWESRRALSGYLKNFEYYEALFHDKLRSVGRHEALSHDE